MKAARGAVGKILFAVALINTATVYLDIWPQNIAYAVSASVVPIVMLGLLWEMSYGRTY